jgi:hypothetical protein
VQSLWTKIGEAGHCPARFHDSTAGYRGEDAAAFIPSACLEQVNIEISYLIRIQDVWKTIMVVEGSLAGCDLRIT